jgi:hypothetical protein
MKVMNVLPDCSVGRVKGRITKANDQENDWLLIGDDGTGIKCNVVNPKIQEYVESGQSKLWKAYVGVFRDKLVLKLCGVKDNQTPDDGGQFLIRGTLHQVNGTKVYFKIWSPRRNKFFYVLVYGYLPKAEPGQKWEVECELECGKLMILDGRRM